MKSYIESRKRGIFYNKKTRKVNLIGYILRKNGLLNHLTEGKIQGRI
jgi:hypothetical protein